MHSEIVAACNRDTNYLFKFKVGDRVKKAWKWTREQYGRYTGGPEHVPIGSVGTIVSIDEDGTIIVDFTPLYFRRWSVGASELDFAFMKCKICIEGHHLCGNCNNDGTQWVRCDSPTCDELCTKEECEDCEGTGVIPCPNI